MLQDEQGPLFRPIRNNRTDRALVAEGRPFDKLRTAPSVMLPVDGPNGSFFNEEDALPG